MWIFLGILAFIVILITVILLLPVYIIFKSDDDGELMIRYKILFKTFGEDPDPNQPIVKALKEISGVSRLSKEKLQKSAKASSWFETLKDSFSLIVGLLKRLLALVKICKIKVLRINIVCAEGEPDKTAINYGTCYAVISPILNFLHSSMKVRSRGESINISCDFESSESSYDYEVVLTIPFYKVVDALLRAAFDEAKRISKKNTQRIISNKNRK